MRPVHSSTCTVWAETKQMPMPVISAHLTPGAMDFYVDMDLQPSNPVDRQQLVQVQDCAGA
jgi:hypothetical protein